MHYNTKPDKIYRDNLVGENDINNVQHDAQEQRQQNVELVYG